MKPWNLAKLIVQGADSPEEIVEIMQILADPGARTAVDRLLAAFAGPVEDERKVAVDSPSGPELRSVETLPVTADFDRAADSLTQLLRSELGMSNAQVERWFRRDYGVPFGTRGKSLRKYVGRVLGMGGPELYDSIVEGAKRVAGSVSAGGAAERLRVDKADESTRLSLLEQDVAQLRSLLRDKLGFRNQEVVDWLEREFGIVRPGNNRSLSEYLRRLLRESGSGFATEAITRAQSLLAARRGRGGEIERFDRRLRRHVATPR